MENVINNIKDDFQKFAKTSKVEVAKEDGGYRLNETLEGGDAGIMVFFPDNVLSEGIAFNHGWKLEANDPGYLAEACDKLVEILGKYSIPIGVDGSTLKRKSKSYK